MQVKNQSNFSDEMIATRLTPAGRGAIQTLRMSCSLERSSCWSKLPCRSRSGSPIPELEIDGVYYGYWGDPEQTEEIVMCRCDDSSFEIHCHGGDAAANRILRDLERANFRIVTWQENLRQEQSVFETEFIEAISQATTTRTVGILLEQQHGLLRDAVVGMQNIQVVDKTKMVERIDSLLNWSQFGLHLTKPWRIGIFGRPNVGKSSLLNAIAGFSRAIVYEQPGTTRDLVSVPVVAHGWPFELIDTAGVRDDSEDLERQGIEKAKKLFQTVDLRLVLLDLSQPLTCEDLELCRLGSASLFVFHKCDLAFVWDEDAFRTCMQEYHKKIIPTQPTVTVSSKTEEGLEILLDLLEKKLIPVLPTGSTAIPFTRRQIELFTAARQACNENNETAFQDCLSELLR